MTPDLEPRERPGHPSRLSPADRLVSELDGEFYKLSEVAEIVGVSQMTLRRLLHNDKIDAPSYQIKRGKMTIYVYTPEDIQEIKRYYQSSRLPIKRR